MQIEAVNEPSAISMETHYSPSECSKKLNHVDFSGIHYHKNLFLAARFAHQLHLVSAKTIKSWIRRRITFDNSQLFIRLDICYFFMTTFKFFFSGVHKYSRYLLDILNLDAS